MERHRRLSRFLTSDEFLGGLWKFLGFLVSLAFFAWFILWLTWDSLPEGVQSFVANTFPFLMETVYE